LQITKGFYKDRIWETYPQSALRETMSRKGCISTGQRPALGKISVFVENDAINFINLKNPMTRCRPFDRLPAISGTSRVTGSGFVSAQVRNLR